MAIMFFVNRQINLFMTPESLGDYSFAFIYISLFSGFISMSLFQCHLRFTGTVEEVNMISTINLFSSLLFAGGIGLWFSSFSFAMFGFVILNHDLNYFFRGNSEVKSLNFYKISTALLFLLIIQLGERYGTIDAPFMFSVYGSVYLLFFLFFRGLSVFKTVYNFSINDLEKVKDMLVYSAPLAFSYLLRNMYMSIDQIFLKTELDVISFAEFSVAGRVLIFIRSISTLFLLYYPVLYFEHATKANYKVISRIRLVFALILSLSLLLIIVNIDLLYSLLGAEKYLESSNLAMWLLCAEFIRTLAAMYLTVYAYIKRTKIVLYISAIMCFSALSLDFLFLYGSNSAELAVRLQVILALLYGLLVYLTGYRKEKKIFHVAE